MMFWVRPHPVQHTAFRTPPASARRASHLARLSIATALAAWMFGVADGQSASVAARPAGVATPEYRINAGDELDIFVWGEDRMQRAVRVLPDGTFALPLAGTVVAAGRTVGQIAGDVRSRIAGNFRDKVPDVSVAVRSTAGMNFYVVGKVRNPGSYASGRTVDILQALSMSGGLVDFADVKNAVILRQTSQGQVIEPIKLADVLKGARRLSAGPLSTPLPVLQSGDVLVIP